jgi:hypothetical protein
MLEECEGGRGVEAKEAENREHAGTQKKSMKCTDQKEPKQCAEKGERESVMRITVLYRGKKAASGAIPR